MNERANPIEIGLFRLHEQCRTFLEDREARLLRWLIRGDELSMLLAFLEIESGEHGDLPAVFLRCDASFDTSDGYSEALIGGLVESYEAGRGAFEQAGLSPWTPPSMAGSRSGPSRWVSIAESFGEYLSAHFSHVVAFLLPPSVSEPETFERWLREVVERSGPALRLIVPDRLEGPVLGRLETQGDKRIQSLEADLKMGDAVTELAQGASDTDQPSGQFRLQYVALMKAAGAGDVASAERAAREASAIALQHEWYHLEVAVRAALAAAYSRAERQRDALKAYLEAERAAEKVVEQEPKLGDTLRLNVRLSRGAVHITQAGFAEAAAVYESCVPLAEGLEDLGLSLESWRMAAYGHEQSGRPSEAWQCGQKALKVAERMKPESREHSTLPYVGEGLLRLTSRSEYAPYTREIMDRMTELTGKREWRPDEASRGRNK